jgi:hypothetical protein
MLEYGLEVAMGDRGIGSLRQGRFYSWQERGFDDAIHLIPHCV